VLAFRDRHTVGTTGARPGREIRIVWFLIFKKRGAEFASAEHSNLDVPDRRPAEVVPDHPDARQAVLDRGGDDVGRHRETAVAAHRDAGPLRRGELRAHDAAHTKAHRGIAPAVQHALRALWLP